jgi:tetratricopeptide (TPR) repeat protein
MLHQYRGRFADSVALFEQVLSIGQSRDISDFATQSAAELATAHARLGRITEAVEWARSSLSLFSGRRAEVCFLAGQREEALEAAGRSSRAGGKRGGEASRAGCCTGSARSLATAIRRTPTRRSGTTSKP